MTDDEQQTPPAFNPPTFSPPTFSPPTFTPPSFNPPAHGDPAADPGTAPAADVPTEAAVDEVREEDTLPVAVDHSAGEHARIAQERGWVFVNLDDPNLVIAEEVLELLAPKDARRYSAIPVSLRNNKVAVAVANPDDVDQAARLRPLFAGQTMRLVYANPAAIRRGIERHYSAALEAARISETSKKGRVSTVSSVVTAGGNVGRIEGGESENVSMLRLIIEQALSEKASDIHIEPTETHLQVRYRVDGKLHIAGRYPSEAEEGLLTLIKVQAEMRSDNFLVPDSGVLYYQPSDGKAVDIRVETAPTSWGTSAVMRLQSEIWRDLATLGFSEHNERRFRSALTQPYGMILATGPTGSGKSTTLYSAVRERINPDTKIITLENPVEYKISAGVSQMSISEVQGMTFAKGLRSILRQDPDVVLVGEIRDEETAETAVDAAMTGHLLFSTLHTNDAPGVIPRLIRMDIEPFLVSSSLLCVLGQRLVRRLCGDCKVQVAPDLALLEQSRFDLEDLPEFFYEPNTDGCENCVGGFKGRVPIHEVMLLDDALSQAIADNAPFVEIARAARAAGMTSMREDGFGKAKQGLTSIAEVNASTRQELV